MTQPPEYPQGYPPPPPPQGYQPPAGYPPPPAGNFPPPPPQPYSAQYGQPYPPPKKTRWGLIFGLIAVGLVVLIGIGVAAVALLVANNDDVADIFDPNSVSASDIGMGDCLSEIPSDASLVASVKTVDCAEPHKGEVYFVVDVPGSEFPGQAEIIDYQDRCQPALEEFSPAAMADPEVGMFVLYPTEDSWKRGDRAVTCIATTDVPRTGSLQG